MSGLKNTNLLGLVQDLSKKNVTLYVKENELHFNGPKGAITETERKLLKDNKATLIDLLSYKKNKEVAPEKAKREDSLRITAQQKELCLFQQHYPESGAYNVPVVYQLFGKLDIELCNKAINILIERHEILRTRFVLNNGAEPRQVINENVKCAVNVQDVDLDKIKFDIIHEWIHAPFDLASPPLLRVNLINETNDQYTMVWVFHHIIVDFWSVNNLLEEFSNIYNSLVTNNNMEFELLEYQFCDYAEWQANWLSTSEAKKSINYWHEALKDTTEIQFNTGKLMVNDNYQGTRKTFVIAAETQAIIARIAESYHVSEYVVMLAAFAITLQHYTGQEDLVVGSSFTNRDEHAFAKTPGFLINPIGLKVRLDLNKNLRSLLSDIQETVLSAQENKKVPFGVVREVLKSSENNKRKLFNVMFDYAAAQNEPLNLNNIIVEQQEIKFDFAKFYLALSINRCGDTIKGIVEYASSLFDESYIDHFVNHYINILNNMLLLGENIISQLNGHSTADLEMLMKYGSSKQEEIPLNIVAWFIDKVKNSPAKIAITDYSEEISYQDLHMRSNRLANYLQSYGVVEGDHVAILMQRSIDTLVSLLAVLKLGAAYIPLDTTYPEERLQYMLDDSKTVLLITNNTNNRTALKINKTINIDDHYRWIEVADDNFKPIVKDNLLAYIIYTSGSTGKPKGVMVSHENVNNYVNWFMKNFDASEDEVFDFSTPFAFDLTVSCSLLPLLAGAKIVVCSDENKKDAEKYLCHLRDHQVSFIKCTPSFFNQLLPFATGLNLDSLRYIILGGEAVQALDIQKWLQVYPSHNVVNEYGPTEATVATAAFVINHINMNDYKGTFPIGNAAYNTRIYLLNKQKQVVPFGAAGEIYISGRSVARGYWNKSHETQDKFMADPFCCGQVMYKTGDLGRWNKEGKLEYLGRIDEQVKIRGYRIELGEINQVLKEFPGVENSAVVINENNGHKRLVAYYVSKENISVDILRSFAGKSLPEYMVPWAFVKLDVLPVDKNNKIDVQALKKLSSNQHNENYVEPAGEAETKMAKIWSEVIGLPLVGRNDNFFELGGDSISSLQIVSKCQSDGLYLSVKDIFEAPTIAQLSKRVKYYKSIVVEDGLLTGEADLLPVQKWFFELPLKNRNYWNQVFHLKWNGEIDIDKLNEAFRQLVKHHDALRMVFENENGVWKSKYTNNVLDSYVDEYLIDADQDSDDIINSTLLDVQGKLDIEKGLVFKAVVFVLPQLNISHVYIVAHHLIIDGVSWRIILEDLNNVYTQLVKHFAVKLPEKTSSVRQWANELQRIIKDTDLKQDLAFWRSQISGEFSKLVEEDGVENLEKDLKSYSFVLKPDISKYIINKLKQQTGLQIIDVLLAGFIRALSKLKGNQRWLIALDGHGRDVTSHEIDLSRTVGWFTNIYPLALECSLASDPLVDVKSVKQKLLTVPKKGATYGLLRYLSSSDLQCTPQIGFNYLGQGFSKNDEKAFTVVETTSGYDRAAENQHPHLLNINSIILNENVCIDLLYGVKTFDELAIRELADLYLNEIEEIIQKCRSLERKILVPAEFVGCSLSQDEIDFVNSANDNVEKIAPLSKVQQGFLYHYLYHKTTSDYLTQLAWNINGKLNIQKFKQAWDSVLKKYSILRTSFAHANISSPVQVINAHCHMPWQDLDWAQYTEAEQADLFNSWLDQDRRLGFDLNKPPLIRCALIKLGENGFKFISTYDHLIIDGWSLSLVLRDLFDCYESSCELVINDREIGSFADYSSWLSEQQYPQAKDFWRTYLRSYNNIAMFPAEKGERAENKRYGNQTNYLSNELTASINDFAKKNHLTINTIIQGVWAFLLCQYSKQEDVLVGITVSGRNTEYPSIQQMVGMFINTLPLRIKLDQNISIIDWFKQIQINMREIAQHETLSLTEIGDFAKLPIAKYLLTNLVFENYPIEDKILTNHEGKSISDGLSIGSPEPFANTGFPLTITIIPGQRIGINLCYSNQYYTEQYIKQLHGHISNALSFIIKNDKQSLPGLQFMDDEELQQIMCLSTGLKKSLPDNLYFQAIEQHANFNPNNIAIVDGNKQVSYLDLHIKTNKVANYLQSIGVHRNIQVGVCCNRSIETIVAILAINKAGGTYVPLEPNQPTERLSDIVNNAELQMIIAEEKYSRLFNEKITIKKLDDIFLASEDFSCNTPSIVNKSSDLVYMIYTSGTTGKPKGVMINHDNLNNYISWFESDFKVTSNDTFDFSSSFAFDMAITCSLLPLVKGARIIICQDQVKKDIPRYLKHLNEMNISFVKLTPSYFSQLVAFCKHDQLDKIRYIILGGEAVHAKTIQAWLEIYPKHQIVNEYGPTEATVATAAYIINSSNAAELQTSCPIGKPINNTQLYVLDANLKACPVGVVGELYIAGDSVSQGYWKLLEKTQERFIENNNFGNKILYKTGDLAKWNTQGLLEYIGRADRQIKIRGYRVELDEVEHFLMSHGDIKQAAVLFSPYDEAKGELVAYYVPDQFCPTESEIKNYLSSYLPDYMMPNHYIKLIAMPITKNGKADLKSLAEIKPVILTETTMAQPNTATEELMHKIWSEAFKNEKIGIDDDFIELGGHSLKAIFIISKINQLCEINLSIQTLFEFSTVRKLSEHIDLCKWLQVEDNYAQGVLEI